MSREEPVVLPVKSGYTRTVKICEYLKDMCKIFLNKATPSDIQILIEQSCQMHTERLATVQIINCYTSVFAYL